MLTKDQIKAARARVKALRDSIKDLRAAEHIALEAARRAAPSDPDFQRLQDALLCARQDRVMAEENLAYFERDLSAQGKR